MNIQKVIAAVIQKNGKFLIAQRAKKDPSYGKWEFPGGKVEQGETDQECLQRELYEEFGIHAIIGKFLCSSRFEYQGKLMELCSYEVLSWSGDFQLFDHLALLWVDISELHSFDMPAPDKPIVDYLLSNQ